MKAPIMLALTALALAGCQQEQAVQEPVTQTTQPQAVASLHDVMLTMVDPNADAIWDAVSSTVTKTGITEKRPQTEAEWESLRQRALLLAEAGNLLAIAHRPVVAEGKTTSDTDVAGVLNPQQIEQTIHHHFADFSNKAHIFQQAAIKTLNAIEKKDADTLVLVGGELEHACEGCHSQFWYPHAAKPHVTSTSQ